MAVVGSDDAIKTCHIGGKLREHSAALDSINIGYPRCSKRLVCRGFVWTTRQTSTLNSAVFTFFLADYENCSKVIEVGVGRLHAGAQYAGTIDIE